MRLAQRHVDAMKQRDSIALAAAAAAPDVHSKQARVVVGVAYRQVGTAPETAAKIGQRIEGGGIGAGLGGGAGSARYVTDQSVKAGGVRSRRVAVVVVGVSRLHRGFTAPLLVQVLPMLACIALHPVIDQRVDFGRALGWLTVALVSLVQRRADASFGDAALIPVGQLAPQVLVPAWVRHLADDLARSDINARHGWRHWWCRKVEA